MENEIVAYDRRKQVLELLAEHGPLSARGIGILIEPPMEARRMREVLIRLYRRHILYQRQRLSPLAPIYYQIDRHEPARRRAAKILGLASGDSLRQPVFRHLSSVECELLTLWKVRLQRLFPGATILRRPEIKHDPDAVALLPPPKREQTFHPDLLFLSPKDEDGNRVAVAIELEDWCRPAEGFAYKLSRYVRMSRLDGVVVLTDAPRIAMWIERLRASRSRFFTRDQHQQEFFWMFSDDLRPQVLEDIPIITVHPKNISLREWITSMRAAQVVRGELRSERDGAPAAGLEKATESAAQSGKPESFQSAENPPPAANSPSSLP